MGCIIVTLHVSVYCVINNASIIEVSKMHSNEAILFFLYQSNFKIHDVHVLRLGYFLIHCSILRESRSYCNKTNSTNLYPPTKDYLRETCKSQNINPIYLTLRSPPVSFRS